MSGATTKDAFSVNTDRNIFHCFACGASGNVLDFVSGSPPTRCWLVRFRVNAQRDGITLLPIAE